MHRVGRIAHFEELKRRVGRHIDPQGIRGYSITQQYGMYSGTLEETAANGIRENGLVLEGVQGTVAYNADGSYTVTNTRPNDKNVSAFEWGRSHSSGVQAQNVFKSDYVKLREITAGYTVPRLGDTAVKDVRFSVFANNV